MSTVSLLIERFVLIKKISLGNKDNPWFNDDCNSAFDLTQEVHLRRRFFSLSS